MGKEPFTDEFKMMVARYVLEGHTRRDTSEKFELSCISIEKWVNLYKLHGIEGLINRNPVSRQNTDFPPYRLKKCCSPEDFV